MSMTLAERGGRRFAGCLRPPRVATFVATWCDGEAAHPAVKDETRIGKRCEPEADDGPRTRDLRLGKPTLYQLSYVRA